MAKAQYISYQELIQAVADASDSDTRYGFFLGAGASVESGIPAAKVLSEKWLKTIKDNKGADNIELEKWEKEPAKHYSEIFSQRFRANASAGHDELQGYINRATPSIGYLFLAQILTNTKHKFVLTTNFDTMTEDALFSLHNAQKAKPLIIGHTSLADYLSVSNNIRPVIVKLHHDYLLSPKNTEQDTNTLPPEFKKNLPPVLEGVHLIVIGYGGYDTGIMGYLRETTSRKPIYWCCRNKSRLSTEIKSLLTERDFIVEIGGFDRFMLMLNDKLKHDPIIDPDNVEESVLVKNAIKQAKKYQEQLKKLSKKEDIEDDELEVLKPQLPTWWDYELQAIKETDPDKKDEIYQKGLKKYPNSFELHSNYALFLTNIRENHDQAEEHYKKSLELEPDNAIVNGNYALFLTNIRKNHDQAEAYYKKSLELKPDNAIVNGNYAFFLTNIRENHDQTEAYYKKALKLEPDNANINGNYALFLTKIHKKHDQAEKHYKKALELDLDHANNNGNYALFLMDIRKNYDQAEEYYKKALELEPDNANINSNYAVFLNDIHKNYDQAEKHYKKALKLEPDNANINGNYALFLTKIHKKHDQAEKHYKKALELDPDHANNNRNYANFLEVIRKNYDQAEEYYKKSLELEPDDENANNNYAGFLTYIRKDYDQAKKHYKKSLESKPNNATFNGNYANLLKGIRKHYDQAEKHYKKALKLDPDHANNNGNYAQFLLIKGEKSQAQVYLDKAFNFADNDQSLLAELWFYRLAHYPDYRQQAIRQLDVLLKKGAKSIGWDFSANIERAKEQGFEPIELLQQYADKISQ